jgi:TonB-dependent SusC/RagA subfamily outer membrane receptor
VKLNSTFAVLILLFVSGLAIAQQEIPGSSGCATTPSTNPASASPPVIRIRCGTTQKLGDPLLVVDGVILEMGDLKSIHPNDIESIHILKDASATALYGCRGSSGVIVITTKTSHTYKFIVQDFLTGERIPGASIRIRSRNDSIVNATDKGGIFTTDKLRPTENHVITISSSGYKTYSTTSIRKEQVILLERDVKEMSNVTVTAYPTIRCYSGGCGGVSHSTTEKNAVDAGTLAAGLKLYPNPVVRNQSVIVEWNEEKMEMLVLAVTGINGTPVATRSIAVTKGLNRFTIAIEPQWPAGIYIISMTNIEGKRLWQEKLIVQ